MKANYGGTLTWIAYEVDQFQGQEHTFTISETNITLAYKTDEETNIASIVLCNSDAVGNLDIPATIDGYTVTDIAESAFKDCVGLTGVNIPVTVKTIGCHAFDGCTKMTSISIPESITVIEEYSFANSGLTAVDIPNSVVEIRDYAFKNTKAAIFEIPEGVSIVGTGAFSFNTSLAEVTLPDSLTYLADSMFKDSRSLRNVRLPQKLIIIDDNAFYGCYELSSMVLPEGLISIGDSAFCGCGYSSPYYTGRFSSVTLPSTLTHIGHDAFACCQSLQSIEIPNGVTRIENNTFRSCYNLRNISIPSSCTYIGYNAFLQSKVTVTVIFHWSAPEIDGKAFNNTTATCYYPCNNDEWTADKLQNYGGTLTWVAQEMEKPDDSGVDSGETGGDKKPIDVTVDNNTSSAGDGASVTPPENGWTTGNNTFSVESQKPCVVLVSHDGGNTYDKLPATDNGDGTYSFTAEDMTQNSILSVMLLGDVNGDGSIKNADVTMLRAAFLDKAELNW